MPNLSNIVQTRRQRRQRSQRSLAGRLGLTISTLISLVFVGAIITLAVGYIDLTRALPSLNALPVLLDPPNGLLLQPTRLYDRTGEHILLSLENPAAEDKRYLSVGESGASNLPTALISATIVAADPGFWSHPGYVTTGWQDGAHPTLAQRLASDLLLWDEPPSVRRNLRERLLAAQITARFGRQKVLEWYLNSANYGPLVYGADAAARVYFGKSATELSLAEAAVLAAVAEQPAFNPHDAPQTALENGQLVIGAMLLQGMITSDQAYTASKETIALALPIPQRNPAPAFTELVLEKVSTRLPRERLERGGFRVLTTLDYDLQLQASCVTAAHLAALAGSPAEMVTFDGAPCQAARLLPTISTGQPQDSGGLAASMVLLDPHTGQILTLVGDASLGRPSGTLLTPFVYLTGFTRGLNPASLVWDVPPESSDEASTTEAEYHGPMRLRTALANDYLVPAEQILAQVGADNVWRTAAQFGLTSLEQPAGSGDNLDFLIESRIMLMDAVRAYGVFANQGVLAGGGFDSDDRGDPQPVVALKLEDVTGTVWADWESLASKAVLSPQLAYLMAHVLSDETVRWPSLGHPNPLEIGRPTGAKLGWTSQKQDAWVIGFTPQIVVGVWMGYPRVESATEIYPLTAATLWHAMVQYVNRDQPLVDWIMPQGMSRVDVCDPSGMLPTAYCPTVVSEVFLSGSEPTQADTLYRVFQVNRDTGQLATVFTPPELVETRVYLVTPPQAKTWAQQAGLPIPPDAYDTVFLNPSTSLDTNISSPAMFANIRGVVAFTGSAGGEGFEFYRLQVGQGLNPQQWLQIGEDITATVSEDTLGVWDTTELSGLYAVQLLVVRQNQRVETFITQVTVDNHPPEVQVLTPSEDQQFRSGITVVFQASASDNITLASVEFYVDGKLIGTLAEEPFILAWQSRTGTHVLRVRAVDMAGNEKEESVTFIVK